MLQTALADLGSHNPDLAVRLRTHQAIIEHRSSIPATASGPNLEQLREMAEQRLPASRLAQLTLANILGTRGESCHEVRRLVEQGWDNGRLLAEESSEELPATLAVYALVHTDDLERAHELSEAMLADARRRGSVLGFINASSLRGLVALRRGALAEAEADTRAALEQTTEHKLEFTIPFSATYLGLTLVERGEIEQARTVVEGVTLTPDLMELPPGPTLLATRGHVLLACGHRAKAIADLRRCGQLADRARLCNPNVITWRSTLALALASEHRQEALELAQTDLNLARRANTPRAIGIALRVCGLITGGKEGIELLDQSVTVLESSPVRLELAYSLTELGAALRREGERTAARLPLYRALDLAHRCGAAPLAQRARDETLAAGARPRRPWTSGVHALTPSELRVARLAAQNLGNRDIAQALFITTKTVSAHLSSAYRKLNVHSRIELTAAMADQAAG